MKKTFIALCFLLSLILLTGCMQQEQIIIDHRPNRMVVQLEVAFNPADEDLERCYTAQSQINDILNMLRSLDTTEYPKQSPSLNDEKEYCTITAVYAGGGSRVYCLLQEQYLRHDEEEWCIVDKAKASELISYIENNSDD